MEFGAQDFKRVMLQGMDQTYRLFFLVYQDVIVLDKSEGDLPIAGHLDVVTIAVANNYFNMIITCDYQWPIT